MRALLVCALALAVVAVLFLAGYRAGRYVSQRAEKTVSPTLPCESGPETITIDPLKDEIARVLAAMNHDTERIADRFTVNGGEAPWVVHSFLDPRLQRYAAGLLRRSMTRQAAVVMMNPMDGSILAMASYDELGEDGNLCVRAIFPAASLFKFVSAAAAQDASGYTPDRRVSFQGRKYTLYRGQLKEEVGKGASFMSFGEAFASSINPVFGRLGIYHLGTEIMTRYAEQFHFNRPIPFDIHVETSFVEVPADTFGIAEVASGFNRKTLISPLHAAMLAASAVNDGTIMEPRLTDRIVSDSEEILYRSRPRILATPVGRGAATDLKTLMEETVLTGTCRRSFGPLRRNEAYRAVDLGAKTGNISDRDSRHRYDWIIAYALPPKAEEAVCLSVLAVHGEKLGVRAGELARLIIQHYLETRAVSGR